jgi:hypothetical protein
MRSQQQRSASALVASRYQSAYGEPVSILRICSAPGCTTFTLGEYCINHEAPLLGRSSQGETEPTLAASRRDPNSPCPKSAQTTSSHRIVSYRDR